MIPNSDPKRLQKNGQNSNKTVTESWKIGNVTYMEYGCSVVNWGK